MAAVQSSETIHQSEVEPLNPQEASEPVGYNPRPRPVEPVPQVTVTR
jgi:hypothetical protein